MKRLIVGRVAALTVALATAAPASAMHTRDYLDTTRSTRRADRPRRRPPPDHRRRCHGQFDEDGADVTIDEVEPDVFTILVGHDDSCPWYRVFARTGDDQIRLYRKQP